MPSAGPALQRHVRARRRVEGVWHLQRLHTRNVSRGSGPLPRARTYPKSCDRFCVTSFFLDSAAPLPGKKMCVDMEAPGGPIRRLIRRNMRGRSLRMYFRQKLPVASVRVPQGFCFRSSVGDLVTLGAGGDFGEDPATRAPVHFSTEVCRPETCGARAICGAARMPRAQRMRRHRGRRIAHGLSRPRPRSLKRAVWWTGLHRDGASALRDPARNVRPCAATPGRCRGRSRAGVLCFAQRLLVLKPVGEF